MNSTNEMMTDKLQTDTWEELPWFEIERDVFHLQRRIYRSCQREEHTKMHKLQRLLISSRKARCLAVRKATEDSKGKNTAGIDGKKSLTNRQKMVMAESLTLKERPSPVRRVHIPKPGSTQNRPLGIPTLNDRAHQHLLNLALEPQAEAIYSPHQYGFRKGRSTHDAIEAIRAHIRCTPQWAMRIDIAKFFDHLDHEALIGKLGTFRAMEHAIRRILKSEILEGGVLKEPDAGTPQGGPLSPLLANMALAGLEGDTAKAFIPKRIIDGVRVAKAPRIIIYADDAVVLHPERIVLEAVQAFIDEWLAGLGLHLNQDKTTLSHTLEKRHGSAGFTFLGVKIQQIQLGPHQGRAYFKNVFTKISPSAEAMIRLNANVSDVIRSCFRHKRRNAQFQHQENSKGRSSQQEVIIHRLNPILRGWANYYRPYNSKEAFSRMDNLIFHHLLRWAIRTHKKKRRRWIVETFFDGAHPWIFKSTISRNGKQAELIKLASVPIKRHTGVQCHRSYFDGDWPYWTKRSGKYPSVPKPLGGRLKNQNGKCEMCRQAFSRNDRVVLIPSPTPTKKGYRPLRAVHRYCAKSL